MITGGNAVMTNSSMEQALQASSRDPSALVSMGSFLNKGAFALMAAKGIGSVKDLKGKRIAVAQVGDAVYNYTIAFLVEVRDQVTRGHVGACRQRCHRTCGCS